MDYFHDEMGDMMSEQHQKALASAMENLRKNQAAINGVMSSAPAYTAEQLSEKSTEWECNRLYKQPKP